MHHDDNGYAALDEALMKLDQIESHAEFLDFMGQGQIARGAKNTWLNDAIRAAMMPAVTRAQASAKVRQLGGSVHGWALLAARANGHLGAASLILGAVTAEAQKWHLDLPMSLEACSVQRGTRTWPITIEPGVIEAYRKNAKRRLLDPALRRYTALVAQIDPMLARGEDRTLISELIHRSRAALLDVMTVTTRSVVDLRRKQRAFNDCHRLRDDPAAELFSNGVSLCFNTDFQALRLPASEIARLKAGFC